MQVAQHARLLPDIVKPEVLLPILRINSTTFECNKVQQDLGKARPLIKRPQAYCGKLPVGCHLG